MSMPMEFTQAAGWLLLRVTAGVLFFFQGYDKLFKVGITNAAEAFDGSYHNGFLSKPFLHGVLTLSSLVETCGGVLLVLGLWKQVAAILLGLDLIAVALAFSASNPMWDMQYYFPRFAMVVAILMMSPVSDKFCLDALPLFS